ncbi:protein PET100 homolog, mitochondrial isoform X3 [Narcine bancroftii]|uniref:protein PET100 homolog, mitochondrial isoform X3 n=1 Tax=Narcine bancroftii TaxID=1343680 RepID=UPI0038322125
MAACATEGLFLLWTGRLCKMFLYLSFPVTVFWVSNQADYFEEYVIKRKREIYPPEEKMHQDIPVGPNQHQKAGGLHHRGC